MLAVTTIKNCVPGRWRELPTPFGTPILNEGARYFAGPGTPPKLLIKRVSSECRRKFNNKRPKLAGTLRLADNRICGRKCCDWLRDTTALSVKTFWVS